ncbi:MAG TPA: DnaJ domain-containing protein [Polyangiaceae bacterium]
MSDAPGGENGPGQSEPLIFVSDASAEAQRLSTALRERGYQVLDVPLALLVGRVAVQKPALILCDVDADHALETAHRLRDVPGGAHVDLIFFGEAGRALLEKRDSVFHEASGVFTRPVDTYALLRKVEALIGAPNAQAEQALASAERRASVRIQPSPFSTRNAVPSTGMDAERPASSPPDPRLSSRPPGGARARSPSAPPSLPAAVPLGFGAGPDATQRPLAKYIPQSEMSPELEQLLARAEQRLSNVPLSVGSASARLSPEDEVEAVLPADVLAALDESLDPDEDDDEFSSSGGIGTRTGSAATRTGAGTGAGATTLGLPSFSAAVNALPDPQEALTSTAPEPPGAPVVRTPEPEDAGFEPHESATPAEPIARRSSVPADGLAPPDASRAPPLSPSQHAGLGSRPPVTAVEPWVSEADPNAGETREPSVAPEAPPLRTDRSGLAQSLVPNQQALTQPPPRVRDSSFNDSLRLSLPTALPSLGPMVSRPPSAAPSELDIPTALGRSDAVLALARAIRARYAGALAFEDAAGIRRVVFRDGDFVTAASGIEGESLVAFMTKRGDLSADAAARLGRKLPQFGRHAGAALIAHGHLRQDDLWPALRAHAEWLLGRIIEIERGAASLERQVPGRLQEEPAVFGGAAGAEVLVETVRRTVAPEEALLRLGGRSAVLRAGAGQSLLAECALNDHEVSVLNNGAQCSVQELLEAAGSTDFASVIYALRELGVVNVLRAGEAAETASPRREAFDELDEDALRDRIRNRRAIVDEGDYFNVLGVGRTATSYDIKRAYLELRREFEPSRVLTVRTLELKDDVDTILEIADEAYEILRDPVRRERYRRALDARPR